MKKLRKVLSILMSMLITVNMFTSNIFAEDNDIYEERNQVELRNLNFSFSNNELHITSKSRNSTLEDENAISMIEESEVLKEVITDMVNKGAAPVAIGCTKVYLKDEIQEDGTVARVPMTNFDISKSRAIGNDSYSPTKAFKLYTAASFVGDKIAATSAADYIDTGFVTQDEYPQVGCYDYIGLAMPVQYTLSGEELNKTFIRSYTEDNTNNAILMGILLRPSPSAPAVSDIKLSAYGLKNSEIANKKVISHYVHNWNTAKLSISLTTSGGGLSVSTTTRNWKISSYIVI